MKADNNAVYDKVIDIDLSKLTPLAAQPHSPDAVAPISEIKGIKVNQVAIGSCTNSSLDDLARVAAIVKGKHIAPGVEAGIAPGSRTTLLMAEKAGILGELITQVSEFLKAPAGPCIGMGLLRIRRRVAQNIYRILKAGAEHRCRSLSRSPETAAAAAVPEL